MFEDFNTVSHKEWTDKLIIDLKGKDSAILSLHDEIEGLELSTYYHNSEQLNSNAEPGNFPYLRGMNRSDNSWSNGVLIDIQDEKKANKKALMLLNKGVDLLIFKSGKQDINWKLVFDGILFEHIQTQFVVQNESEFMAIKDLLPQSHNVFFNIDFLGLGWSKETFNTIASTFQDNQQPFCSIDGFKLNRSGANASQEVAFSLSLGHHYLTELMALGFSIDEAAACLSFKLGIGSNYLFEVGKFRAFREGWARIIKAYNPQHSCSYNCHVTAVSGFMNKSLKDPYTNLLRQTTEAMSALNGGADSIVIMPYDAYSENGSSELAERMAVNISLILKEESYFDKVIDALGGSYSVEEITEKIGLNAWTLFQKLESAGGMNDSKAIDLIRDAVKDTAEKRIAKVISGEKTLIGINKYPNPEEQETHWNKMESYLDIPMLILENEYKTVSHA